MRNTAFSVAPANQTKAKNTVRQDWTKYEISTIFAAAGGLFFLLAGFVLQVIYTVFERNRPALNYAGVGALVVAVIFFGFTAHFIDKSDEDKRRQKRERIEKLSRKQF